MTQAITIDNETQVILEMTKDCKSDRALAFAQSFEITNDETYQRAGKGLLHMKAGYDKLKAGYDHLAEEPKSTLKKLKEIFSPRIKDYESAIEVITEKISVHRRAMAIEIKEAERKAQEKLERDKARLIEGMEDASPEQRQLVEEQAAMMIPDPIKTAAPLVDGLTWSGRWTATVVDDEKFVAWCLEGGKDRIKKYLNPNYASLNKDATAQRDSLAIPGVTAAYKEHARRTA